MLHALQRAEQLACLVLGAHDDSLAEIAARDAIGHAHGLLQRARDGADDGHCPSDGQRHRQQRGNAHVALQRLRGLLGPVTGGFRHLSLVVHLLGQRGLVGALGGTQLGLQPADGFVLLLLLHQRQVLVARLEKVGPALGHALQQRAPLLRCHQALKHHVVLAHIGAGRANLLQRRAGVGFIFKDGQVAELDGLLVDTVSGRAQGLGDGDAHCHHVLQFGALDGRAHQAHGAQGHQQQQHGGKRHGEAGRYLESVHPRVLLARGPAGGPVAVHPPLQ